MNEELFTKVLANRAELSNKKKRINTKIAVRNLRIKLGTLETEGYDLDAVMNVMLERGWLGVQKKWLTMLKPRHLTTTRAVSEATDSLVRSTRIPKSDFAKKQMYADDVRKVGNDALARLKNITGTK